MQIDLNAISYDSEDESEEDQFTEEDEQEAPGMIQRIQKVDWKSKIVIQRDSQSYLIFKIVVISFGLISSIFYAFFAAFRIDVDSKFDQNGEFEGFRESSYFTDKQLKTFNYVQLLFELTFLIHTLVGFITEY